MACLRGKMIIFCNAFWILYTSQCMYLYVDATWTDDKRWKFHVPFCCEIGKRNQKVVQLFERYFLFKVPSSLFQPSLSGDWWSRRGFSDKCSVNLRYQSGLDENYLKFVCLRQNSGQFIQASEQKIVGLFVKMYEPGTPGPNSLQKGERCLEPWIKILHWQILSVVCSPVSVASKARMATKTALIRIFIPQLSSVSVIWTRVQVHSFTGDHPTPHNQSKFRWKRSKRVSFANESVPQNSSQKFLWFLLCPNDLERRFLEKPVKCFKL